MYDPPHLLKSIRNNLKATGYINQLNGKFVMWKWVVQTYNKDSPSGLLKMLPKINDMHIDLPPFKNMSVKLAAQVLSHSMGAAMSAMIHLDEISNDAATTATFLKTLDTLFDIFNSKFFDTAKEFHRPINIGDPESVLEELGRLKIYMSHVETMSSGNVACIKGWLQNIEALTQLISILQNWPM